jgi:hypothetical protein
MSAIPVYPFDSDRLIGTVTEVAGTYVKLNLPNASAPGSRWHHGARLEAGRVGEFVVIEASDHAVFGRISSVKLPEKERLAVEEELGRASEAHPIGLAQMMCTVGLHNSRIEAGVPIHPRLGSRCFSAHPELIRWLAEHTKLTPGREPKLLELACLPFAKDTMIRLSPESVYGRHCAILGATGGGKSFSLARLIEQTCKLNSKVLLIDATGEYFTMRAEHVRHVHIGADLDAEEQGSEEVVLPYPRLTESDLFALFKPSALSQAPKLRAAMKSLKLVAAEPGLGDERGLLRKAGQLRKPIDDAMVGHARTLEKQDALFKIELLKEQIQEECIQIYSNDTAKFGMFDQKEVGFCSSMIQRVEQLVSAPELACIFRPKEKPDLIKKVLLPFLEDPSHRILRVSLKELPFEHGIREVLVNAIGRYLLTEARKDRFRRLPLVVVLDEAHQFLGKAVGEEHSQHRLDSFELIAKEGRKYCLTMCLATQRPRDLGQGVLSQMGTFLVHRLTNPEDRELVEKAAGDLDRSAAAFLPTLAAGQAVLIGIDFPIPVTLQMLRPEHEPASRGPMYQEHWAGTDFTECNQTAPAVVAGG